MYIKDTGGNPKCVRFKKLHLYIEIEIKWPYITCICTLSTPLLAPKILGEKT